MDGIGGFSPGNVATYLAWMVENASGYKSNATEAAEAAQYALQATEKEMGRFLRTKHTHTNEVDAFREWVRMRQGEKSETIFNELMKNVGGGGASQPVPPPAKKGQSTPASRVPRSILPPTAVKSTPVKPARGIRLYNHVCTAKLEHRTQPDFVFHPLVLVDVLRGAYARNGFKCVTLKQINPDVCSHVYQNRKVVACGAEEEIHALLAIYKIQFALEKKMGWPLQLGEYRVTNQVLSGALGVGLDLHATSVMLGETCRYDPTVFPGLHYFPMWPVTKPCILLYRSGKYCVVAMTGVHTLLRSAMILSTIPLFPIYRNRVSDDDNRKGPIDPSTALYWSVHQILGV
jgi:TATA-box binding protein (TBP) (component of TFIID and TFIIIB)